MSLTIKIVHETSDDVWSCSNKNGDFEYAVKKFEKILYPKCLVFIIIYYNQFDKPEKIYQNIRIFIV